MSTSAILNRSKRLPVVVADSVAAGHARIPGSVVDLQSFRRWATSDQLPQRGQFSYLGGELWVDLSMEQLFSHNGLKTVFTVGLGGLVRAERRGYFFSDRVLLSNQKAELSTEPDGSYVSYEALRAGLVRLIEGAEEGYVELESAPDMVLEIVSPSSVQKDTEVLRDLYWRAGIPEYWLVDARGSVLQFEIFRHRTRGYVATRRQGGWLKSAVFDRAFQLTQQLDPLGNPQYTLGMKTV
jgi:Uma2 family endonuclease